MSLKCWGNTCLLKVC